MLFLFECYKVKEYWTGYAYGDAVLPPAARECPLTFSYTFCSFSLGIFYEVHNCCWHFK